MEHIELGKAGEALAERVLITKGHDILERNYRHGKGELDIISMHSDMIVFTEVKTRHSNALMEPQRAVNHSKQRQIIKMANAYLLERNIDREVRFDIVSVVLNTQSPKIEHIENAFYPLV